MIKRLGPKRVSVFEVGAGKVPSGVLGQAIRAQKKRAGREFIASDLELRREETLRQRGLRQEPSNLKLVKGCSIKELLKLPKSSTDIIFGSFFLNNYAFNKRTQSFDMKKLLSFLTRAKDALTPRGRIIMIQNPNLFDYFVEASKKVGLKTHVVKLTPAQMENSSAEAINMRSTYEKRLKLLMDDIEEQSPFGLLQLRERMNLPEVKKLLAEGADARHPVAIIMRK